MSLPVATASSNTFSAVGKIAGREGLNVDITLPEAACRHREDQVMHFVGETFEPWNQSAEVPLHGTSAEHGKKSLFHSNRAVQKLIEMSTTGQIENEPALTGRKCPLHHSAN